MQAELFDAALEWKTAATAPSADLELAHNLPETAAEEGGAEEGASEEFWGLLSAKVRRLSEGRNGWGWGGGQAGRRSAPDALRPPHVAP